jgi:glycosyltransferase involved in cell wall biosynthesis
MTKPHWAFIHPFQLRLQRGIETYLWELASALGRCGIAVDILTWAGPMQIPAYLHPSVKIKTVPAVRYYQSLVAIPYYAKDLIQNRYDHIFLHFVSYGEGPALHLAQKLAAFRYSVVFHFPPSLVPHRYREFERWGVHHSADHLIAVSQATAREVEQWADRSCTVIGHGVDVDRFRPDPVLGTRTRKQLGIAADVPILITVAALEERKGVQWVIRALPKVLESFPDARYLVVGDGPFRKDLEEHVQHLHIEQHVLFLGFESQVTQLLNASDVALLLSWGEASPISLLEYAASALPVITSCHEPFPELVKSEWGAMVNEQDTEILSQKIITLLSDSSLRERKGECGRSWVTQNHGWHQVAQEYVDLLENRK